MSTVAVGGTFEYLHYGHKKLLEKAVELATNGGEVHIGVTSDKMANNSKINVSGYHIRKNNIIHYMNTKYAGNINYRIFELNNSFGPAIEYDYDYIVVSPETYNNALKINEFRKKNGLNLIKIIQINYILAEDGKPISSTRIKKGIIDSNGKLIL